jgi:uncharacterized membrane protein YgaE (UPF0421/DUF939 family)
VADAGWSVVLTPLAAGLAWYIAHTLLGHHDPFFAPTAAAVSLSKVRVLRTQRGLQLIIGVVLGIGVGTAVRAVAGSPPGASGAVVIAVAALIALAAAVILGGGFFEQGVLFVNQATTSAILMIAVGGSATSYERLCDALVGGGVTLMFTAVLFPVDPLALIRDAARQVLAGLHDALAGLADFADAGTRAGPDWALATGQRVHDRLAGLDQARSNARQVAAFAPRRWPERSRVRQADQQTASLHLLAATVLSLVHASTVPPDAGQPPAPAPREALRELTSALAVQGGPDATRASQHAVRARCLVTDAAQTGGPHSQLVARLIQACADDILRLTGDSGDAGHTGSA